MVGGHVVGRSRVRYDDTTCRVRVVGSRGLYVSAGAKLLGPEYLVGLKAI